MKFPKQVRPGRGVGTSAGSIAMPAGVVPADQRPWPLNGRVINNSPDPVQVWSDDRGLYSIAGNGGESARYTEDVDHIRDRNGQWYKISYHTVTVNRNGSIEDFECRVSSFGKDCGQ